MAKQVFDSPDLLRLIYSFGTPEHRKFTQTLKEELKIKAIKIDGYPDNVVWMTILYVTLNGIWLPINGAFVARDTITSLFGQTGLLSFLHSLSLRTIRPRIVRVHVVLFRGIL